MVACSRRSLFNRIEAVGTFAAVALSFSSVAVAQIQQDVDQCLGKDGTRPDQQVIACTAVIASKTYTGKELAFAFNNRGLVYYARRDIDHAISDYTEATKLDPNFARGYANRAIAYEAQRQLDRAMADYNQAIKLDRDYASALDGRGNIYLALKDYDSAIADYTAAIKLEPTNPRPLGFGLN
jgi:tetratricopeptide (TPR) repeat protein